MSASSHPCPQFAFTIHNPRITKSRYHSPSRLTREDGALLETELEDTGAEAKGREAENVGEEGHGVGLV